MGKLKKRQNTAKLNLIKERSDSGSVPAQQRKPLFSFQFLDARYCISCCEKDDKAALADQLRILGSKTWAELQQAPKHGIGCERIERNAINGSFPRHLENDKSVAFLAFRFSGKKPMVGYRDDEVFHIIWLVR